MASRIEDYGLIGNTRTAALVSRSGSIDWLCTPRFDSDACFAALVGYDEHGSWALRPAVRVRESKQRYRDNSMVLETDLICEGGAVRITDFMPIADGCDVVRIVEGLDGEVPVEMLLDRPLRLRRGLAADRDDEGRNALHGRARRADPARAAVADAGRPPRLIDAAGPEGRPDPAAADLVSVALAAAPDGRPRADAGGDRCVTGGNGPAAAPIKDGGATPCCARC